MLVLLLLAAGLGVDIYRYSFQTDSGVADAAIVLGAAVTDGQPSPVFEERIRHAVDLYRTGRVPLLLLTGGRGAGDALSEAVVASRYARAHGVPSGALVCETTSRVTRDNLRGAAQWTDSHDLGRVLVVSDPLHMRRSVVMARDLGLDAHPSPTPTSRYRSVRSQLSFGVREVYFYAGYLAARWFIEANEPPMAVGPCPASAAAARPRVEPIRGKP